MQRVVTVLIERIQTRLYSMLERESQLATRGEMRLPPRTLRRTSSSSIEARMIQTKIAYQCNEHGVFIGETLVQEDPMSAGEYLVPPNATLEAPPDVEDGQQAVFAGGSWTVENTPTPITPESKPLTLAQARALQLESLKQACRAAIESGFASDALGVTHNYPSSISDQTNQNTIANCLNGGYLKCEKDGVWALIAHTQRQARAVIDAFAVWLNACQAQIVISAKHVDLAMTVADVQAVAWTDPVFPSEDVEIAGSK